uniref:IclR family transcriptional regulator C-terminal domain-containing protein n=1 Tax=Streptomyces caniscabiei TaxID=2746961 RepID=UPI0018C8BB0E
MLLGASGRAYISFCTERERETVLRRLREHDAPGNAYAHDPGWLRRLLATTRSRGYSARAPEYDFDGRNSIAVPIRLHGQVPGMRQRHLAQDGHVGAGSGTAPPGRPSDRGASDRRAGFGGRRPLTTRCRRRRELRRPPARPSSAHASPQGLCGRPAPGSTGVLVHGAPVPAECTDDRADTAARAGVFAVPPGDRGSDRPCPARGPAELGRVSKVDLEL